MNNETLVVIPTFNEADNIARLIGVVLDQDESISVLVVDDGSPDGTSAIVEDMAGQFPNKVFVMNRGGKDGRGGAVLDGIVWGLERDYEYIIEMDADFSHEPAEIPLLLEKIKEYDFVIGSRYLKESKIVNWPRSRRVFSKLANSYARFFLGIPISDYTNGYRIYTRKTASNLDRNRIDAKGYIVLSEVAFQLYRKGFTIGEIPTIFVNRRRGESNLTKSEILTAFLSILRLRLNARKLYPKTKRL